MRKDSIVCAIKNLQDAFYTHTGTQIKALTLPARVFDALWTEARKMCKELGVPDERLTLNYEFTLYGTRIMREFDGLTKAFQEEHRSVCGVPQKYSDTEILDWLQKQNDKGRYTGRCIFRWSLNGRGWRLHETSMVDVPETAEQSIFQDVRSAIMKAMDDYNA